MVNVIVSKENVFFIIVLLVKYYNPGVLDGWKDIDAFSFLTVLKYYCCDTELKHHKSNKIVFFSFSVSVLAFTAMALLAFFEFFVYRDTWMKYEYEVDKDFTR